MKKSDYWEHKIVSNLKGENSEFTKVFVLQSMGISYTYY